MERYYIGLFRVLSCLLFCSSFAAFSTNLVQLSDDDIYLKINDKVLWHAVELKNPNNAAELIKAAQQSNTTYNSLLGKNGAAVAKIPIATGGAGDWYVMPMANFVDSGVAFWQDEYGTMTLVADFSQLNKNNQAYLAHRQAFRLNFTESTSGYLWIYIKAKLYPTPANIVIQSEFGFSQTQLKINTFTVLSVSVMLTLALMAFVVYLRTKHFVAFYCAGYIGLHGIGWAFASGLIQSFLSSTLMNTTYGGIYIFPFAIAFASYFAFYLFDLKKSKNWIARGLVLYAKVALLFGVLGILLPFKSAFYMTHILACAWIVLSIFVGIKMLTVRDFKAKYFLVGNVLYSLALGYFMVSHSSDLDLKYPEIVVLVALALDCICIQLSLSEWLRIKQIEHQKVLNDARFDSLTLVGNRHYLNEKLKELSEFYMTVFIDCDSIKSINDKHGHAEGDVFLKYVADLMNNKLGDLGQVFRTGGDEFIWVCEAVSEHRLSLMGSKIKTILNSIDESVTFRWPESGISFGIATSIESDSPSNCLSKADERMYQQKTLRKLKL